MSVGAVLEQLRALPARPALWAAGEPHFWDDPHISRQMLAAHLDPDTDAASRRPETIDRQVGWIAGRLGLTPGCRVLDLGCGPGLYAQRFARRGLAVTGIDCSRSSIDHARGQAGREGLRIEYLCQDYLELESEAAFDAALLIYYDFGVLSDWDRDLLLRLVHGALVPGGRFVLDVLTKEGRAAARAGAGWRVSGGGFWRPGPHLVLTRVVEYPEAGVELDEYAVVDEAGTAAVYRIWQHYYSPEAIAQVMEAAGFTVDSIHADLAGTPPGPGCAALGIVARKA